MLNGIEAVDNDVGEWRWQKFLRFRKHCRWHDWNPNYDKVWRLELLI